MSGLNVTLDPKSVAKLTKRLQIIERNMNPAPRTPMGDLINITGLDVARFAMQRAPVITGRLKSSIHAKLKPSDSFIYSDKDGNIYNGGLEAPIIEGKEVVVGTNVNYALSASLNAKQANRRKYLELGAKDALPNMKRRLASLAKKVVNGETPNITMT